MTARPEMELPEPAAALWLRVRDVLEDALRDVLRDGSRAGLGGGTVLAATWNHRKSNDIDVKIYRAGTLGQMDAERNGHCVRTLERAGGRLIANNERQMVFAFSDGELDVRETEPAHLGTDREMTILGKVATIEPVESILHGKLTGRGGRNPVRDLFDIAVAAQNDRRALERAVNCLAKSRAHRIAETWIGLTRFYDGMAEKAIEGTPDRYTGLKKNVAGYANEAIIDAQYHSIEIVGKNHDTSVRTTCNDGTTRTTPIRGTTIRGMRRELKRTGIWSYVTHNTEASREDVLKQLEQYTRAPQADETVIWQAGCKPTQRRGAEPELGPGAGPDTPVPPVQPAAGGSTRTATRATTQPPKATQARRRR